MTETAESPGTPAMVPPRPVSRGTLFAIFTLSGFSGLIYESIWSHYLKMFLGHAAYAQTLVLTVFMGGMALGAWLAARLSPRLRNLLLIYALVEAVTGAIALGFHPVYLAATGFTFDAVIPALDSPAAINLAKWSIAALLILPQSILLGSTFPLISGGLVRRYPEHPGATLAMLYFTNSLGAALGVLTSGFLLIGSVGLPGTVVIAGLVNLAIAAFVWRRSGPEPAAPAAATAPVTDTDIRLSRRILLAAFLSGAAAFIYEIAWIRMLSLVLGSSTHAFELMLSAFILGLAFGGAWIRRRIDSLPQPMATLASLFALMAALGVCTLPAYGYTFDLLGSAVRALPSTDAGYTAFNLASHAIAAVIMIPTTFIAGMTLPVMTHVLLGRAGERAIGRVYASNTVGAIAGVLLAVHLLLPGVGLKGTVIVAALLQVGIAAVFALGQPLTAELRRARLAMSACVLLLLVSGIFVHLDPMRMASGVYRHGSARLPDDFRVISLRDGKTATISLVREQEVVSIATNGKPDASIHMGPPGSPTADEVTMTLAAALPLAMHRAPHLKVANIGIGSGLTSHVALASPTVGRLDSVEIEAVMAESARAGFGPRVRLLFEDPRSHIHIEDAKTFFSASKQQYDVIISEPSNPWVSGVATLFSDEFYSQITRYLAPGGLLVQWIQIYETDITVVASVLKALAPHFRDYAVYSTDDSNILIVATRDSTLPPIANRLFEAPALAAELERVGVHSLADIEIRRIGNKRMLDPWVARAPVPANSDFHPYVDLNAPRMRFLKRNALELVTLSLQPVPLAEIFGAPLTQPSTDSPLSARYFMRHRKAMEARATLRALQAQDDSIAPPDTRAALAALRPTSADCASPAGRADWLAATYALAVATTPFLTTAERMPLWQAVGTHACAAGLDPAQAAWLGLLEGAGRGDTPAIAAMGEKLFTGGQPNLTGAQLIEALLMTVSAKTVIGQQEDAQALLNAYLPTLRNPGDYRLALQLVVAQANARRP